MGRITGSRATRLDTKMNRRTTDIRSCRGNGIFSERNDTFVRELLSEMIAVPFGR